MIKYTVTSTKPELTESNNTPSLGQETIESLRQMKEYLAVQEGLLIEKGLKSDDPLEVIKATKAWQDVQEREQSNLKSQLVDPNQWTQGVGYKAKRFALDYSTLRRMATTPIIAAIISRRQSQIARFAKPQRGKYDIGFVIQRKPDYYSADAVNNELSKKDKAIIKELTEFLLNGGTTSNAWHGDTFDTFLKKIVKDSLELDQACFEISRNKFGVPTEFVAIDGSTIRIADTIDDDDKDVDTTKGNVIKGYRPSYVQVIDQQIYNEYYPWELCFGTRNTTTDITSNNYGKSEIEQLINIITWMLFSDAYNGKFFSNGSNPKGIMKIAPGVNRNRLNEFRQEWMSMVTGVNNAWKIPVIESDKMEFIDLQKNNTDMQFEKWQEYLVKIACSVYKIAPEEIGFDLSRGGGLINNDSDNDTKLKFSKDEGLGPLLTSIEFWINKWIIGAYNPDFEFKFVGLDVDSESKEVDLDIKKLTSFMGWKEIRKKYNLPDEFEDGDFPLNSTFTGYQTQLQYAQQQQQSTDSVDEDMDKGLSDQLSSDPLILDAYKMLFDE